MSTNGRLPVGELAPIPGGQLRKDAAAAWNAMCQEAQRRGLPVPVPDGPASSYRTYAQQVELRREWCARGVCGNAAVPGTSRHGWGIAVDCAEDAVHHAATIDAIGERYGWSKKWSDAPWEPWHNTYKVGIWRQIVYRFLPLHVGRAGKAKPSSGLWVYVLTGRLANCGYLKAHHGEFDYTVETAVTKFQWRHHLAQDGIVGPFTWETLKTAEAICKRTRKPEWTKPL